MILIFSFIYALGLAILPLAPLLEDEVSQSSVSIQRILRQQTNVQSKPKLQLSGIKRTGENVPMLHVDERIMPRISSIDAIARLTTTVDEIRQNFTIVASHLADLNRNHFINLYPWHAD